MICLDLSREQVSEAAICCAQLIAFFIPMHTATRLALEFLPLARRLNPSAHFCAYGLYAPLAVQSFHTLGVNSLFGGEFEQPLCDLLEHLSGLSAFPQIHPLDSNISLARLRFQVPDRAGLPSLRAYAHLILPSGQHRTVGYTEASRGCKHLCRHCPIVPVYKGVFRIVDREVVLADIRQQVAAGAQHITFGDPDFFNGIGHAIPVVEALHREFPDLTYDVTIKVEHLLQNAGLLPTLCNTGCLFVVTAVESLDDHVLANLEKGHTRADFFQLVELFRQTGLTLQPTFIPFTPWTTFDNYLELMVEIRRLNLIESVAAIQLAIRLLIPPASRILELQEIQRLIGPYDSSALAYPWQNPNPALDDLSSELRTIVAASGKFKKSRTETFELIWRATDRAAGRSVSESSIPIPDPPIAVPYLNEPWYC